MEEIFNACEVSLERLGDEDMQYRLQVHVPRHPAWTLVKTKFGGSRYCMSLLALWYMTCVVTSVAIVFSSALCDLSFTVHDDSSRLLSGSAFYSLTSSRVLLFCAPQK